MNDFGFGRKCIEAAINIEEDEIIADALLAQDINVRIIDILWQLVAGSRLSKDDPEGMKFQESRLFSILFQYQEYSQDGHAMNKELLL